MFLCRLISAFFLLLFFSKSLAYGQVLSSSNLPIVIVNTGEGVFIPNEPKVDAYMRIVYNKDHQRNNVTDSPNNYDGHIGIERRGSSSQGFPKTQYGIELRTATGADSAASLLGMPAEEDWILFAPYNDKSLMRDVLAYKLARDQGRYAPRTKYCELILNGQYQGVYVLEEKIKRDRSRVDISKLEAEGSDDNSGGYLLKIDKLEGAVPFGFASRQSPLHAQANQFIYFQVDYPEPINQEQQNYIQQFMHEFEATLQSEEYFHPEQGYAAYIDVPSFIDFLIVNELSKNVDAYRISTFMHKDKNSEGGKLKMGPVWDFNLAFGNANYCTSGEPQGFVFNFNAVCPTDGWLVPFWWNRLLSDGNFKRQLGERWSELRTHVYATEHVHAYIDSVAAVLDQESQQRNFQRWPVLGTWVWPNFYVGNSFADEVAFLKNWTRDRLEWLDNQWGPYITSGEKELPAMKAYPNPSHNGWRVELPGKSGELEIHLITPLGKVVSEMSVPPGKKNVIMIQNASLPDGVYILRVLHQGETPQIIKLVKGEGRP